MGSLQGITEGQHVATPSFSDSALRTLRPGELLVVRWAWALQGACRMQGGLYGVRPLGDPSQAVALKTLPDRDTRPWG